ncbi:MAG: magnesium transporter, partial [Alphaproteobacteria bacterium HGW-Alphaproteobacteria-8]
MLRAFGQTDGRLTRLDGADAAALRTAVWIDLASPTALEEGAAAAALDLVVPTREDMEEIEISSRLYVEGGAAFMTVTLPSDTDGDAPHLDAISFVLSHGRLLTVRHSTPRAFDTFPVRAEKVQ